ncbi:MAG TPA: hypothetical protein VGM90_12805 [Kofleriaceae bacterium]|jgi:hypothetical protein
MSILLKDYDLDAAKERMRSHIDFERRLSTDFGWTQAIRECKAPPWAAEMVSYSLLAALEALPVSEGGTAAPVGPNGAWEAVVENLTLDLPLVQALLMLSAYPGHPGFHGVKFERPGQTNGPNPGPVIDALRAAHPQTWDLAKARDLIFDGMCRAFGDSTIDPDWLPDEIYPGSRISNYTHGLHDILLYDMFGAFDPRFTRQDALCGEWWLLQPVSPRLVQWQLASRVGLQLAGYLPPNYVDAEGRVVLVCYARDRMSDAHRIQLIENERFIAGWQKVLWSKDCSPLADPTFDLVTGGLKGVTENSYGPYRHSAELPPWPPSMAT